MTKQEDKSNTDGAVATTVSLGAHINQKLRDKLKLYQDVNGFHNVSDALGDVLEKMPMPKSKEKPKEPDPDQTILPGCES